MAKIKPFKGYRYNSQKIDDLSTVIAPPFEFISKNEGKTYFDMHPFNAIRFVSSKKFDEGKDENPYVRAADFLREAIDKDIVVQDEREAIYIYEQKVIVNNEPFYSRGFVALLELSEYENGLVVPCEEPSTNSKYDKFSMVKEAEANGSMISFKYTDKNKTLSDIIANVIEKEPIMDFATSDGISQRLWMITSKPILRTIVSEFADKLVYIVDGHNRYESYVDYRNFMREQEGKKIANAPYNYTLGYFTESSDDGMVQMPVHRLVRFAKGFNEQYIIACLQENFKVEKIIVDPLDDLIWETMKKQVATQRKETKLAIYCGENYFYRLTLKSYESMDKIMPDASDIYKRIDLAVLNKLVLEDVCNIREDNSDDRVFYTTNTKEGVEAVRRNEFQALFIVNPVRKHQMSDITMSGELLPKKSLAVFPKPSTGVIIYKF